VDSDLYLDLYLYSDLQMTASIMLGTRHWMLDSEYLVCNGKCFVVKSVKPFLTME